MALEGHASRVEESGARIVRGGTYCGDGRHNAGVQTRSCLQLAFPLTASSNEYLPVYRAP